MAGKKSNKINFEESIESLNDLIENMESGELSLEDSLKEFEKGIKLIRTCQKTLNDAEQKVKILIQENGKETLEDVTEIDTENK